MYIILAAIGAICLIVGVRELIIAVNLWYEGKQ